MASTIYVDKLDPQSGTALEIGSSGDTITIPSGATITNSGTANGFGVGKIGQVVNEITSTVETFTSGTLTASGLTASITPSATSSKIYVLYNAPVLMSGTANSYAEMRLFRDTTELKIFTDIGCYNNAAQVSTQTFHYEYLDSPSSVSSITYSVKYAEHGSSTININNSSGSGGAGSSTMTLLEVLA
jgi:hypothetical protein